MTRKTLDFLVFGTFSNLAIRKKYFLAVRKLMGNMNTLLITQCVFTNTHCVITITHCVFAKMITHFTNLTPRLLRRVWVVSIAAAPPIPIGTYIQGVSPTPPFGRQLVGWLVLRRHRALHK